MPTTLDLVVPLAHGPSTCPIQRFMSNGRSLLLARGKREICVARITGRRRSAKRLSVLRGCLGLPLPALPAHPPNEEVFLRSQ